jgi:predicted transcriptional regulator
MVELCVKQGLREPEFVEEGGFFKVIIYRAVLNELQRQVLEAVRREVTSAEVAKELRINERTARKHLSSLCSMGLVAKKRAGRKILYYQP